MENNKQNIHEAQSSQNYDLKSKAVEDLLDEETPEFTQEELNKYRKKKGFRIPEVVKVLFLKAWFAGAVCYFILWGLGIYVKGLDMMFVLCVAMGMVTDLLLNNVIRFIEKTPGANDKWIFVRHKGVVGFGLNILYGFLVVIAVYTVYNIINLICVTITGNPDVIYLGVEPLLFGLISMGCDMLFIAIKRLLGSILRDAKKAAGTR